MSRSTTRVSEPLQTERQRDGRRRLLRDLVIEVDGICITIPEGAITDFSSIPALGRVLVRWSRVDVAGVVHDWLYHTGEMPRWQADRIWRLVAVAGEHHANSFQAFVGWWGLRLFGWHAWSAYRRHDET